MNSLKQVHTIAVVGAGTMGAGIAQMAATAGFPTLLFDIRTDLVEQGLAGIRKNLAQAVEKGKMQETTAQEILGRVQPVSHFRDLQAELFIEAVLEKLEVKQKIFRDLAGWNAADSIFASNTSSIPITQLASGIPHPGRVVGMHFFNPAHLMKLVEVVSGTQTSPEVAALVSDLCRHMNKVPVAALDYPGFIVNRIGKLYHTEPLRILEEGSATIEAMDALMEASGFKMGPFRLIDLIGVDANLNVTRSLYELSGKEPKFRPSPIQEQMVADGRNGRKSGKGFYDYSAKS